MGVRHISALKCMCHSAHIFRCSYSSRATRRLLFGNGRSSPELCNPIQYCLACRNLSIPPDVKMSSKNTLRCSSGIIILKKRFHRKRSMPFRPTLHDDRRLQIALPGDVFHRATYKNVGMALNLNRLIVSAPPCISYLILFSETSRMTVLAIVQQHSCHPKNYKVTKEKTNKQKRNRQNNMKVKLSLSKP